MKERETSAIDRAEAAPDDSEGAPAGAAPPRERRSAHRVADDQGSGHGAMTALAKLKMLERRRRLVGRPREDGDESGPSAR